MVKMECTQIYRIFSLQSPWNRVKRGLGGEKVSESEVGRSQPATTTTKNGICSARGVLYAMK